MMELFDKQFVRFMWDDALKGKKCFVSDYVDDLKGFVERDRSDMCFEVVGKGTANYPFEVLHNDTHNSYQFAYYDPNYGAKKAFNEGKKIEFCHRDAHNYWMDATTPTWRADCEYREKPEEEKWIAYIQRNNGKCECRLVFCAEGRWEYVQDHFGAKTKLFVGTYAEASAWCRARQKFATTIKAWEDGKEIQLYDTLISIWRSVLNPVWDVNFDYREKPECPCEKGIDSKACVGCQQSEGGKKKWRPYKNSAEMIEDFSIRFKVNCPPYAEPLVWVKGKYSDACFLVFAFYGTFIKFNDNEPLMFNELFNDYTYLDGSPCGMEEKE